MRVCQAGLNQDRAVIDACDVVVALLMAPKCDDVTAWEIGYAFAMGKPVVGIRTDFRNAGDTDHVLVNAMIEGSYVCIAKNIEEILKLLQQVNVRKTICFSHMLCDRHHFG